MFEDKFIIIHSFFFIIYIFSKNFILQIILIWYGHNKYKIHNIKILFRIAIRHLWISKKTKCRVYDYQKVACRIRRISDVRQLAIVRWRNDLINLGGRRTGGDLDLAVLSPPFRFLTWPLFLLSVRRRFGSFPPALAISIKTKARLAIFALDIEYDDIYSRNGEDFVPRRRLASKKNAIIFIGFCSM